MKNIILVLFLLLIIEESSFAKQGVELEMEVKEGQQTDITKMVVLDNSLKMELTTGNPSAKSKDFMTFDGEKMCTVDNKNSECNCMNKEDFNKLAVELNKKFAEFDIEKMLKDVPEAQREFVRQQMEKSMPKQTAAKKISKPDLKLVGNEKYNNFSSRKYLLKSEGEETNLWVTEWNNIEGGKEISQAFINLGTFFDGMVEALSQLPGADKRGENNFLRIMDDVNGFIHSSKSFESGKLKSESKLLKSYKRDVNPAEFSS
ncbi:MAG: hypothetical protein ACRENO_07145, partial [Thermodesulfobacteriota bacterium]